MRIDRRLLWVPAIALVGGCAAVGPDFKSPEVASPTAWPAAIALPTPDPDVHSVVVQRPFDDAHWWMVFHDPVLDGLVRDAAAQNLDVRTAALRIETARAQIRSAQASGLPSASLAGVAGRSRQSANSPISALAGGSSGASSGSSSSAGDSSEQAPSLVSNLYQVGFDATWEIDFWGKVRRNVEASTADRQSAEEARRDALISLTAEVARTYLGLRADERQLAIAQADLATQQRLGQLIGSRHDAGFAPQSDVASQSAQVQLALSQLPQLRQQAAQARNRLAMLLALPPGALVQRLEATPANTSLPPEVPVGLPGDLLRRRPDIRKSEADLHAATARVGVAVAQLYPSVTLGLFGGFQSTSFGTLTDWASRFLIGGLDVSMPIFEAGKLKAQIRIADLQSQQALLTYRKTVLQAFNEVDDAINAYSEEQRRAAALLRQWQQAQSGRQLTLARYESGLAAYTEVLAADRNMHQAEQQVAQSTDQASTDLVAVYKALGGGWNDADIVSANPPAN